MRRSLWLLLPLLGCSSSAPSTRAAAPAASGVPMPAPVVPVELREIDGRWTLLRGGAPYQVRGVGFIEGLDALVAAGGNSVRTWGIGEDTRGLLDAAWAKGVSVTLGIWLGHVEHGFDYGDEAAVAEQLARARGEVERYKDHPALLMWGVGNEVELEGGDDPRIWRAIEEVAKMIHAIDPNHPTMVVTAELGDAHAARLREHCPSIDVWGINAYGGGPSLPARLPREQWNRPIALTEFGGLGPWERPKHAWGAAREETSTEKAAMYARTYEAVAADPRTVATYAFVWAYGENPVDNWSSLLGPGGLRYEPVDTLTRLWGQPVADASPTVQTGLTELDGRVVEPGANITATLNAQDPEGEGLVYDWVLHVDTVANAGPGPALACTSNAGATFRATAPESPGAYRLLGVARDPSGRAAFATARFHVGPPQAAPQARLPLWVDGAFQPSGWMGDATRGALKMRACEPPKDLCRGPCRRFEVRRGEEGWAGVVWQHPPQNWEGKVPGVPVPKGAKTVSVTAWGEAGGETLTIGVGNREVDGFERSTRIELTTEPKVYTLSLAGASYEDVVYGFSWVASPKPKETLRFSISDITWSP